MDPGADGGWAAQICCDCGAITDDPLAWRCTGCGGTFEVPAPPLDVATIDQRRSGLWRYGAWLPVAAPLSLGEPRTPLVTLRWGDDLTVRFKLEGAQPTGSFKDRGAAVMIAWLYERGVHEIMLDSSGNAGASAAAYCACAGVRCRVYVPEHASPAKLAQLLAYGATVVTVSGSRSAAAETARAAVLTGVGAYAPHSWRAPFVAGMQTLAYELWEQLDRTAPATVIMPVGGGSLLLGTYTGFLALQRAGLCDRIPRLIGVQSAACAPLARAFAAGATAALQIELGPSAAEGIQIADPPRGPEVLAAVRATDGHLMEVDDDALWSALRALGERGIYAEPTAAVSTAALTQLSADGVISGDEPVVVVVTGTGLKSGAAIGEELSGRRRAAAPA